jgi:hypothetical protein
MGKSPIKGPHLLRDCFYEVISGAQELPDNPKDEDASQTEAELMKGVFA